MAARIFFDYFHYLSDTAGQMQDYHPPEPEGAKKAEARLNEEENGALNAYMRDRFLKNRSEVLRSALAQFLVREGYLESPSSRTTEEGVDAGLASRRKVKYSSGPAPVGAVVITDTEGRITTVNRAFTKMCGYTLKELRGKKPGDLLQGPATEKDVVRDFRRAIKAIKPFTCTMANYDKSRRLYHVHIQMRPLFEGSKHVGFEAVERRLD